MFNYFWFADVRLILMVLIPFITEFHPTKGGGLVGSVAWGGTNAIDGRLPSTATPMEVFQRVRQLFEADYWGAKIERELVVRSFEASQDQARQTKEKNTIIN